MKKVLLPFAALMVLLLVQGCGKISKNDTAFVDQNFSAVLDANHTEEDIEALKKENLQYWDYSSKAMYAKSFDFELPYLQFLYPKEWYLNFRASDKRGYKTAITKIEFDPDERYLAYVTVELLYKGSKIKLREKWYKINTDWYHKFTPSYLPSIE